ncbi:helix-turn-helix domain-containing protein [Propionicicella superfundia]|uniref:helix-turn-helix domain-containing protein n=1 Tax=Propionicicella superfundia TaxID=348582 RepID=UPI00041C9594|nr:helix-turn-helix domain-containing protein [Propionicicella superfundia]
MADRLDELFAYLPTVLTVEEVADLLRVSKPGVYKWLRDKTIPGYKLGNAWFILRDQLRDHLRAGTNLTPASGPDSPESGEDSPLP